MLVQFDLNHRRYNKAIAVAPDRRSKLEGQREGALTVEKVPEAT